MIEQDLQDETKIKSTENTRRKVRVFWASDSPTVSTGFGRVSYELITRLLKTGKYQIIVQGTNDRGQAHPLRGVKDLIIEPLPYISEDPYGLQAMPELLQKYRPDIVFALNDVWVWTGDERRPQMMNWFAKHLKGYKPYVPFVGYFPVDGRPWAPIWKDMVNSMTFAVPFSDYGVNVLKETPGVDMKKVRRVYHGSTCDKFKPLNKEENKDVKQAMQISEDTFLIGTVCFKKGTQVLMSDFSTKNIEDIQAGDKIINHLGNEDTVVEPMSRKYNGKMHKVELVGTCGSIECTENHKFWAIRKEDIIKEKKIYYSEIKSYQYDFDQFDLRPEWIPINSLKSGDFLTMAIPSKIKDVDFIDCSKYNDSVNDQKNKRFLPDEIKLDKDFCRLIGLFLAEGSYNYVNERPVALSFTISTKEEYLVNEIKRIIKNKFDLNCNVRAAYRNNDETGYLTIEISSTALAELFKDLVPCKDARDKQMVPWLLDIDPEKQLEIFDGWRLGDGCLSTEKSSGGQRIIIITASKILAKQMEIICLRNRISYYTNESYTVLNNKQFLRYRFVIPLNTHREHVFYNGNYYYRPIRSNDVIDYNGIVYNMEVENLHSYIIVSDCATMSCCVSNCRNQPRKSVPRLIQAFKMFRDGYVKCAICGFPRNYELHKDCELCGSTVYYEKIEGHQDSALYLHMNVMDMRGYKLPKIIADNRADNIITRPNHDVAVGVSVEELNRLYNAFDVHVLPTTAGGCELPVLEAQAAGTPNITTRTTAVTELMDNECGYMTLPETHVILEDANHCYKHLIGIQALLDSLETAYQDWKTNSPRRQRIIENGLKNAQKKTWDRAAKEFDDIFQEALATRVPLHEVVESPNKQAVPLVFINDTDDLSKLLASLPALETITNAHGGKIVLAAKEKFLPLVQIPKLETIPIEYMWIDDEGLKNKKVSIQPIMGIIDKYESGIIGSPELSWSDVFCKAFHIDENNHINYQVTDEEKEWARKMLDYQEDDKSYRVLSVVDINDANTSLTLQSWNQTNTFIGKLENTVRISLSDQYLAETIVSDIKLHSLTLREIIAIMSQVNCVITSDDSYIYVANILSNVKFIFVQGPRDNSFNVFGDNVIFISEKMKYQCMPCWKKSGMSCKVSGNARSACMNTIIPGEMFSKVLRLKKTFDTK